MGPPDVPFLVHGMGKEPAPACWAPLRADEVAEVLGRYPAAGDVHQVGVEVIWHSPRPTSAAALVRTAGGTFFLKRHLGQVRCPAQLAAEHAFVSFLRLHGQPVPAVLATAAGRTSVLHGDYVYEAHEAAPGDDLQRQDLAWSPYPSPAHAEAAGAALGRMHKCAMAYKGPERPFGVLMNSVAIVSSPLGAAGQLRRLAQDRPALARALGRYPWEHDVQAELEAPARRAHDCLKSLPRCWGHGDWHGTNLLWAPPGRPNVSTIIDFGLCNLTFAVHDLALAIERGCIDWLDLAGRGEVTFDRRAARALVKAYLRERPLSAPERLCLPAVLEVCHVEHALSELEYFYAVAGAPEDADLAYDNYLLGHLRWYRSPAGAELMSVLSTWLG